MAFLESSFALLRGASSALKNSRCCILRVDEASGEVVSWMSSRVPQERLWHSRFEAGQGLAGIVALRQLGVTIQDARRDHRFVRLSHRRISSAMGAPILSGDKVLGVITAVHPQPRAFGSRGLEILNSFARLAARLIECEAGAGTRGEPSLPTSGLLSEISHEMRTPLTTISALTSLMLAEKAGALSPLQRDFLTSIRLGARKLNHIADHFRDLCLNE